MNILPIDGTLYRDQIKVNYNVWSHQVISKCVITYGI